MTGQNRIQENTEYEQRMKQLMNDMGLNQEDDKEDELLNTPIFPYIPMQSLPAAGGRRGYPEGSGLERSMSLPMYGSQGAMQAGQPGPQGRQMPYLGDGNTCAVNIRYASADGTMYQMSMIAPEQDKAKGLQKMLAGLYCMMMSDGDKSHPGGKAYQPGKSSPAKPYAGSKGKR